ncbi:hypothetical protein [Bacillus sp. T33-2]|uniref:hypothetical protein n=1 Tax=Bacillus sp. T33-2 TaxID=2054168 RepID=UPI000C756663|nr:hypothetical protein [Bacillus sp. T33-2]PLR99896.1 hypothetical protein CVD19_02250 [Bacillus sp. T33-2]
MKKIGFFLLALFFLPLCQAQALSEHLTVDMHYVVVSPAEDGSSILKHMINYTNTSDTEYKGDGSSEGVINVRLPQGAFALQINDQSLGIKETGNGFVTTKPIPAKETQVLPFSYQVPAGVPIGLTLDYPLQVMQVLVPEGAGSVDIEGAKAANQGMMEFEEKNFWFYNVEGIEAGKPLTIIYQKNKQPPADEAAGAGTETGAQTGDNQENTGNVTRTDPGFHNPGHLRMWYQSPLKQFNAHILMIVLGAILAAGIGYYLYFKWRSRLEEQRIDADKEEKAFKLLVAKQNTIMDKILELEDSYSHGQVNEAEYSAKLDAYKHHLVQVKLNLRQFIE